MSKITIQKDSTLLVPDVPTVPYITGDGVGADYSRCSRSESLWG